jgi:NHLM bacteriocin system ABC transporter peptidase/ATP-binding protein
MLEKIKSIFKKTDAGIPSKVRTPTVLQMEAVECGAASLAIVLGYYKKIVPLEELRIACGVSRDGSNAKNLLAAARSYGLEAKGKKLSIERLKQFKGPIILFWNFNHFVVYEGFKNGKFYISDPAEGRYRVNEEEFDDSFTGVSLIFEKGTEFKKGNDKSGLLPALLSRVQHSWTPIIYITLTSLFLAVTGLIIPSFTQIFVDSYIVNRMDQWVMPLILVMFFVLILSSITTYLKSYYQMRLSTKLSLAHSSSFFWHILKLPIDFFNQRHAGEISSRIGLNSSVANIMSGQVASAFLNVIFVIFYGILCFTYEWRLTLLASGISIFNLVYARLISRERIDSSRKIKNESQKLSASTMTGIQQIETLKATGRENDFFKDWTGYIAKVTNLSQANDMMGIRLNLFPTLLGTLNSSAIMGVGALAVMDGSLTLGELIAFQYLIGRFTGPVNALVGMIDTIQFMQGNMERIDDVLKYPIAPQFKEDNKSAQATSNATKKMKGFLELKEITFGYNKMAPPLIESFNLSLSPGRRVALVGGSGSGKSTVAKLITGTYEPWSGDILFDGHEQVKVSREIMTSSLALIDQNTILFEGTIKENINLWDTTMPEGEIIQAAKDADIHDTITERDQAYDSKLDEGGFNLSGGQRQRLDIARALAINPSIIVLDEGTSALDPNSEKIIMDNLRRRGCTCIIVAHRLSTIRDCDEIIVMHQGKIVQRGTHDELKTKEGVYAALIKAG